MMPESPRDNGPRLGPPEELARGDFEMVIRRLADDLAFGTDTSLFTGSGLEYAQSRPYEPGDPIKQIDWRMTARASRTYVKEYEALKKRADPRHAAVRKFKFKRHLKKEGYDNWFIRAP